MTWCRSSPRPITPCAPSRPTSPSASWPRCAATSKPSARASARSGGAPALRVACRGSRSKLVRGEAPELGFLLYCAEATVVSALARTESRGAPAREDHPQRDDKKWLRHSLAFRDEDGGTPRMGYKPVAITKFEPKARVY